VEGVLLYRPPIDNLIDYKVFLDISFDEVFRRAVARDVPKYGEEFLQKYIKRYIPAQKIYLKQFSPKEKCHLIIDNNNFKRPLYKVNTPALRAYRRLKLKYYLHHNSR
jgi:uridine kinase